MCLSAQENGFKRIYVPTKNLDEAKLVNDIEIISVDSIKDLILKVNSNLSIKKNISKLNINNSNYDVDFSDIYGQEKAKRALEIAAAGRHHCLLIGEPGVGKTMLAKRLITIFPKLDYSEIVEISKIKSIVGNLKENQIETNRPFIEINPNITMSSFVGGGRNPIPGVITLANLGVLFMDEFAEFDRQKIEILRTILDNKRIKIDRNERSIIYPCNFVLIASMNPCPCGYFGSLNKKCICSESKIKRYRSKISGPILDRIDIQFNVSKNSIMEIENGKKNETSAEIRKRVEVAWNLQKIRFKNDKINTNSEMQAKQLKKYCILTEEANRLLERVYRKINFNTRTYTNILRIGRTIADLDNKEIIDISCIAEAVQYKVNNLYE